MMDNNAHHRKAEQSHNEAYWYKPNKSYVREAYERQKKISRRGRKRYSSGISAKDLKLFTKAIGFKSSADGVHEYICELVDFVIDSKRVHCASKCPQGSKFLQHQIV